MARTIAEHRAKGTASRATWHQIVSVAGESSGRIQVLLAERADIEDELDAIPSRDPESPDPSRTYADVDPRVEIRERLKAKDAEIEAVRAEVEDDLIDLTMQVKHSGEWVRWVESNPPKDGRSLDEAWECDVDALAVESMDWVVKASGESVSADDVKWLHENVSHGDKHEAAQTILRMQYGKTSIPKSLTGLRNGRPTSDD